MQMTPACLEKLPQAGIAFPSPNLADSNHEPHFAGLDPFWELIPRPSGTTSGSSKSLPPGWGECKAGNPIWRSNKEVRRQCDSGIPRDVTGLMQPSRLVCPILVSSRNFTDTLSKMPRSDVNLKRILARPTEMQQVQVSPDNITEHYDNLAHVLNSIRSEFVHNMEEIVQTNWPNAHLDIAASSRIT
jgi:hypothetical protein